MPSPNAKPPVDEGQQVVFSGGRPVDVGTPEYWDLYNQGLDLQFPPLRNDQLQVDPWNQTFNTALWGMTSLLPAPGAGPKSTAAGMARGKRPVRDSAKRSKGWVATDVPSVAEPVKQPEPEPLWPGGRGVEDRRFRYAPERAQQDKLASEAKTDPRSMDMLTHDVMGALHRIARRFGRPDRFLTSNERADKPAAQSAEAQVSRRDLLQEGLAMLKPEVESYDPDRGSFMKHFYPHAIRNIGRYAVESGRNVSGIPRFEKPGSDLERAILKTAKDFQAKHGTMPSADFIRMKMRDQRVTPTLVEAVLGQYNEPREAGKTVSLSARVKGKRGTNAEGMGEREPTVADTLSTKPTQEDADTRSAYAKAIESLNEQEKAVLLAKYEQGLSGRAAATSLGMPHQNYVRALAKAEAKLRSLISGTPAPEAPPGTKPIGGGSDGPVDPYDPNVDRANGRKALDQSRRNDALLKDHFNQETTDSYRKFLAHGGPDKEPDPEIVRQLQAKQGYNISGRRDENEPYPSELGEAARSLRLGSEWYADYEGHPAFSHLTEPQSMPVLETGQKWPGTNRNKQMPIFDIKTEEWRPDRRPAKPIGGGSGAMNTPFDQFNQRTTDDYARFVVHGDPRDITEPDPNIVRQLQNPGQNLGDASPEGIPINQLDRFYAQPDVDRSSQAGAQAWRDREAAGYGFNQTTLPGSPSLQSERGRPSTRQPLFAIKEQSWAPEFGPAGNPTGTQPHHRPRPISGGSDAMDNVAEAMNRLIGRRQALSGGMHDPSGNEGRGKRYPAKGGAHNQRDLLAIPETDTQSAIARRMYGEYTDFPFSWEDTNPHPWADLDNRRPPGYFWDGMSDVLPYHRGSMDQMVTGRAVNQDILHGATRRLPSQATRYKPLGDLQVNPGAGAGAWRQVVPDEELRGKPRFGKQPLPPKEH